MLSKKNISIMHVGLILLLSGGGPSAQDLLATEQADATRVYLTAEAIMTEAAEAFTATPTATMTETPTATPTNSPTPGTAATSTNPPQVTPCNLIGFVSDVTIPDGTEFEPGEAFTKTWRLRNDGTCTWDSTYKVVYVSGNQMNGPASQQLTTGTIAPGGTIDVTVDLKAPETADTYFSYYLLQSGSGENFGVDQAGSAFYVQIEVTGDSADPTATQEAEPTATSETPESTVEPTDES